MTDNREELLERLDKAAADIVGACVKLGLTAVFVRDLDEPKEFRLICPQSLQASVLLQCAQNHLDKMMPRC